MTIRVSKPEFNLDSIFIADHTYLGNKGEIFECTALMAAFAALTKRINIGVS